MAALHLAEVKYRNGLGYPKVELCTGKSEEEAMGKAAGFKARLPLISQRDARISYAGGTQRTEERR